MEHALFNCADTKYEYVWWLQVQPEWWLFASIDQSTVLITVWSLMSTTVGPQNQQQLFGVLSNLQFQCQGTSGGSGDGQNWWCGHAGIGSNCRHTDSCRSPHCPICYSIAAGSCQGYVAFKDGVGRMAGLCRFTELSIARDEMRGTS